MRPCLLGGIFLTNNPYSTASGGNLTWYGHWHCSPRKWQLSAYNFNSHLDWIWYESAILMLWSGSTLMFQSSTMIKGLGAWVMRNAYARREWWFCWWVQNANTGRNGTSSNLMKEEIGWRRDKEILTDDWSNKISRHVIMAFLRGGDMVFLQCVVPI